MYVCDKADVNEEDLRRLARLAVERAPMGVGTEELGTLARYGDTPKEIKRFLNRHLNGCGSCKTEFLRAYQISQTVEGLLTAFRMHEKNPRTVGVIIDRESGTVEEIKPPRDTGQKVGPW